ncbi:MAG: prephenate dehydratase [Thermincolia bacterium]
MSGNQNLEKIAYLGPKGTFTEEALVRYLGERKAEVIPLATIPEVIKAVRDGVVDKGVVPIENSMEGTVNVTVDLLVKAVEINILAEIIIPIRHHLLAQPGTKMVDITTIISHPQALAQCRHFLSNRLPETSLVEAPSTAEAANEVARGSKGWAAVGNQRAACLYQLELLARDIQECKDNSTRFVVLGRGESQPSGNDLTSVVFSAPHRPGGLFGLLEEFASRNLNLTKIESRPAKRTLGEYLFILDLEGHYHNLKVQEALTAVASSVDLFRVLGSYPKDIQGMVGDGAEPLGPEHSHFLNHLRGEIDSIDRQVVELLAQRNELVQKIGRLKEPSRIRDYGREAKILERLKNQAARRGLNPELIEGIYSKLFEYFVSLQEKRE